MSDKVVSATQPDLSKAAFWAQSHREREASFAQLRAEAPVSWHPRPEGSLIPALGDGPDGFWAITDYDDIRAVSRNPADFLSAPGILLDEIPPAMTEASQSFIAADGERHRTLRGLVSRGFTPRHIGHMQAGIEEDARRIVDELEDHPEGDFVELVAKRLPLLTFARFMGVTPEDRDAVVDAADAAVSYANPVWLDGRDPLQAVAGALMVIHETSARYCAERRSAPGADLLSALAGAEVDGERLTDFEIASFIALLSVAANDTTRHTTSHAMLALSENPDQRTLLAEDFDAHIDTALEEFVRWATPVINMRRTTAREVQIAGVTIPAGEHVAMFYESGNRAPEVFEEPGRFDVTRDPNRHLGFGGGGPHYCMGAALAKLQLRTLFRELLGRYPQLETGAPRYLVGNFVNGISELPMRLGPAC